MDVVCDHCKTEYEFDDALVSERGTTVKCTNCGHQFKIFRPASEAEVGRVWNLRRPDGTVIPFDSLAVLQKWIVEGRVSKMDEIARPGDPWKPLGAIAELETFFTNAEARAQSVPSRGVPRTPSAGRSLPPLQRAPTPASGVANKVIPSRVPPPAPSATTSGNTVRSAAPPPAPRTAPLPRAPGGTTPGFPVPRPTGVPADLPPRAAAHEPPAVPPPPREESPEPPRAKATEAEVPGLRDAPPPSPRTAERDDDVPTTTMGGEDFSPPRATPRRGGMLAGLAIGLVLAGGAGLAAWKSGVLGGQQGTPAETASPPRARAEDIANILTRARGHTRATYDDAVEGLTRLLGANPRDAAVLAARAQVLAAWAEMERDHAADLDRRAARAADGAGLRAEAALLRRESAQRIERARADLAGAAATLPDVSSAMRGDVEALLMDATRVVGARDDARRYAAMVRARGERAASQDVLLALSARDEGDATGAISALQAAIARQDDVRGRLALARLLLAQGDVGGARTQLDAVTSRGPGHEDAAALASLIEVADAGVAPPSPGPAPSLPAAVAVAPAVTDAGAPPRPATTPAPVAAGAGYDRLVAEGDRLQNDGRTAAAEERYRAALAARPNGAEALTGLGYVEIDRRSYGGAISRFRQALQSNPNFSDAYIGLGEAYASQSRYAQALEAYNRYLEVNPGGSRASMARRQIESLQDRVRHANEGPAPGAEGPSGEPESP